jgi:thiol-disulfide isomerase/thioredoxin
MRRALLLVLVLGCTPNEPPKNVDPAPSASAAPSATAADTAPTASATAPVASATPSAAPTTTSAPVANTVTPFHAVPLSGGGDLAVPVAGKVTYVQFCASWCIPCAKLLPIAQGFHAKYKDKGLAVVAVEEDDTKAQVMPFTKKMGVTFPVFWDEGNKLGTSWKVATMPTGIVIGRSGSISYTQRGYTDGEEAALEKAITGALAEPVK